MMNKYFTKIELPKMKFDAAGKIIECLKLNADHIEAPFPSVSKEFTKDPIAFDTKFKKLEQKTALTELLLSNSELTFLKEWPNKLEFIKDILEPHIKLNYKNLKFVIQRITGKSLPPHSDIRTCSLIYTIKGAATTRWYSSNKFAQGSIYLDNSTLKLEESVSMDLNSWYLFNHYEIHDVTSISDDERVSFVINLSDKFVSYQDALENLQEIFT